jgi:hypothetical protein
MRRCRVLRELRPVVLAITADLGQPAGQGYCRLTRGAARRLRTRSAEQAAPLLRVDGLPSGEHVHELLDPARAGVCSLGARDPI